MIKCPFCREKYTIDFDIKDLSKLISSNSSHIEILRKARNKINDSINLDIKNIKTDMKEIRNNHKCIIISTPFLIMPTKTFQMFASKICKFSSIIW